MGLTRAKLHVPVRKSLHHRVTLHYFLETLTKYKMINCHFPTIRECSRVLSTISNILQGHNSLENPLLTWIM